MISELAYRRILITIYAILTTGIFSIYFALDIPHYLDGAFGEKDIYLGVAAIIVGIIGYSISMLSDSETDKFFINFTLFALIPIINILILVTTIFIVLIALIFTGIDIFKEKFVTPMKMD
jgi:chromate transport protein ChrA